MYIAVFPIEFVLEMALGHWLIFEVQTSWLGFRWQFHVPMSVQIPRELRFSSVFGMFRLLPPLRS